MEKLIEALQKLQALLDSHEATHFGANDSEPLGHIWCAIGKVFASGEPYSDRTGDAWELYSCTEGYSAFGSKINTHVKGVCKAILDAPLGKKEEVRERLARVAYWRAEEYFADNFICSR